MKISRSKVKIIACELKTVGCIVEILGCNSESIYFVPDIILTVMGLITR